MRIESELQERSNSSCELCSSKSDLKVFELLPSIDGGVEECVMLCTTCLEQIEDPEKVDVNHWRCLNDSMWSEVRPVQVLSWRMLYQLRTEGWTQDLLDMLYLDEETMKWAKAGVSDNTREAGTIHKDSNGAQLLAGDTVVLIKDLNVKGAGFTAKRGTAVRGISLVNDNADHIEGKVNGQQIVILTKFVKKSS